MWVSVKDRLPPIDEEGTYHTLTHEGGYGFNDLHPTVTNWINGWSDSSFANGSKANVKYITHWLPNTKEELRDNNLDRILKHD